MVSKNCLITGEHVGIISIATLWPAKNIVNFGFKRLYLKNGTVNFFIIEFWKQDKMQLLAEFKKILYIENLRWLWTLCTDFFFNSTKSFMLSSLSKFYNKKKFTVPFLRYKRLKLKLSVFLAGYSVAMVTNSVTKIIPTCSPVIEQFVDTMIVASIDREWL